MLMENLSLHSDEERCIKYDLKGSRRNRFVKEQRTSNKQGGKVYLDTNFLQDMKSRPIPMQYAMKRLMNIAIHNDSMYLSRQAVIDYSMFVIIVAFG